MDWGNCDTDSKGRPIGYNARGTCDHPGCTEKIHRGLAYVCGDMHGDDEYSCEGYFCDKHRRHYVPQGSGTVCASCYEANWQAWWEEFQAIAGRMSVPVSTDQQSYRDQFFDEGMTAKEAALSEAGEMALREVREEVERFPPALRKRLRAQACGNG